METAGELFDRKLAVSVDVCTLEEVLVVGPPSFLKQLVNALFLSCDPAYWDSGPGGTHRMLILRRMLIGNRARPGGFLKKTFFSAFMLRSAGTHRMAIFRRMLIQIQPRRALIAPNPHRTIKRKKRVP